jgi:hypothetical protein
MILLIAIFPKIRIEHPILYFVLILVSHSTSKTSYMINSEEK